MSLFGDVSIHCVLNGDVREDQAHIILNDVAIAVKVIAIGVKEVTEVFVSSESCYLRNLIRAKSFSLLMDC